MLGKQPFLLLLEDRHETPLPGVDAIFRQKPALSRDLECLGELP